MILKTQFAGLEFPNPIGLAAGLDKHAITLQGMTKVGFGFIEVGTVTPNPQPGNPKPRLFTLHEDRAVINRCGFNNDGAERVRERLKRKPGGKIIGINIGANSSSADRINDYVRVLSECGPYADYAAINVSSPNTKQLRDLQKGPALVELLDRISMERDNLEKPIPVFLKISPDIDYREMVEIAGICRDAAIDGIIATNSTTERNGLKSKFANEAGGLSGKPLFQHSTRILATFYKLTEGKIPLIGVGGIS